MKKSRLFVNSFVSLFVLASFIAAPEWAVAGKNSKVKRPKRGPQNVVVSPPNESREVNPLISAIFQEEAEEQNHPTVEPEDRNEKRERSEGDEHAAVVVKKERLDEEFAAALVIGNLPQMQVNPENLNRLPESRPEEPQQNPRQPMPLLTEHEFQALQSKAIAGDPLAMNYLASKYFRYLIAGISKEESERHAFEWWSKAAAKGRVIFQSSPVAEFSPVEQSILDAQNHLAGMYLEGRVAGLSREESDKLAFEWWNEAATKGDVFAQTNLARMYLFDRVRGLSREESDKLAFEWFSKAAKNEDAKAKYMIGLMYLKGRVAGVSKDESDRLAISWIRSAAAKGYPAALDYIQKKGLAQQPVAIAIEPVVDPGMRTYVNFLQYFSSPQVQIDLQDDVRKVLAFDANAKMNTGDPSRAISQVSRVIIPLKNFLERFQPIPAESRLGKFSELLVSQVKQSILVRTIPEYVECFKMAHNEPVLVSCLNVSSEYIYNFEQDQDEYKQKWGRLLTLGKERVSKSRRIISQLIQNKEPAPNHVYREAHGFLKFACEQDADIDIPFPQDFSVLSCYLFVTTTLKTLETAQSAYHVTRGQLVDPDPFVPAIHFFNSLNHYLTQMSDTMNEVIKNQAPRRNAVLMKDEKYQFLRPAGAAARVVEKMGDS